MTSPGQESQWNRDRTEPPQGAQPFPEGGDPTLTRVEHVDPSPGEQSTGDVAKREAGQVKDTAVESGKRVAETAKGEAKQVAGEAGRELRSLADKGLGEVRNQASQQQQRLTTSVRGWADELAAITRGEGTQGGPVSQIANDLNNRGQNLAHWLETHEPEDVLEAVGSFARRRPIAFLAIAAGVGMLAGRFARGLQADAQAQDEPHPEAPQQLYRGSDVTTAPGAALDHSPQTGDAPLAPGQVDPLTEGAPAFHEADPTAPGRPGEPGQGEFR